ncbi:unnamed protein product [Parnassius apollo]|uniref:(apollo) hypothetical protein n=1 Tax=Parnassius apollo TaxID=110799 RepID=A0A8S3Y0G1_PARAO|nr:unnamed protein product [Parnassius apollo]
MISEFENLSLGGNNAASNHADPFTHAELTPEQQKTLIDIRRRKTELLLEIQAGPGAAEEERRGSVSNWFSSLRRGGRRRREDTTVPSGYGSLGRRKDGTQSRGKTRSAWDLTTVTRLQLKDELGEVVAELEALDGQEECKQNSKAKQMSIGRKKFNMDPKKRYRIPLRKRTVTKDT